MDFDAYFDVLMLYYALPCILITGRCSFIQEIARIAFLDNQRSCLSETAAPDIPLHCEWELLCAFAFGCANQGFQLLSALGSDIARHSCNACAAANPCCYFG